MKVSSIMTKKPISLKPGDTLKKVLDVLAGNKISGCPVVDDKGQLVGVITQSDILRVIDVHSQIQKSDDIFSLVLAVMKSDRYEDLKIALKKVLKLKIKDFMTDNVVTIYADEDVYKAAKLMNKHDIDRLPVVKNNKLVGIITRWDIIRALERLE